MSIPGAALPLCCPYPDLSIPHQAWVPLCQSLGWDCGAVSVLPLLPFSRAGWKMPWGKMPCAIWDHAIELGDRPGKAKAMGWKVLRKHGSSCVCSLQQLHGNRAVATKPKNLHCVASAFRRAKRDHRLGAGCPAPNHGTLQSLSSRPCLAHRPWVLLEFGSEANYIWWAIGPASPSSHLCIPGCFGSTSLVPLCQLLTGQAWGGTSSCLCASTMWRVVLGIF